MQKSTNAASYICAIRIKRIRTVAFLIILLLTVDENGVIQPNRIVIGLYNNPEDR